MTEIRELLYDLAEDSDEKGEIFDEGEISNAQTDKLMKEQLERRNDYYSNRVKE